MKVRGRFQKGFTIVELIVAISIIMMLAVVVMQTFSGQKSAKFSSDFEQVITRPSQARTLALHSSTIEKNGENVEPYGYGIFINGSTIYTFADVDNDTLNIFDPGDVLLNDPVTINSDFEIIIESGGNSYSGVSLVYTVPFADMVIQVENGRMENQSLLGVTPVLLTSYYPVTITLSDRLDPRAYSKSFLINKISGIPEPLR